GMLTRKALLEGLSSLPHTTPIDEVMRPQFETVHPLDTIETASDRFQKCDCDALPVLEGDHLVGILTIDRIGEYLMLHETMQRRPRRTRREPDDRFRPARAGVNQEVER